MTTTTPSREDLANLSHKAYNNPKENVSLPANYTEIINDKTHQGFHYAVYQNGNNIVLAFAGTDSPADWISDKQMGNNILPNQYNEALNKYLAVKQQFPGANITITGHSLGGSLAQLVAATTGEKAVTFNPYGVTDLLPQLGLRTDVPYPNIENYNLSYDALNLANLAQGKENIGTSYIIPSTSKNPIASHNDFNALKNGSALELKDWQKQHMGQIGCLRAAYKAGNFLLFAYKLTKPGVLIAGYIMKAKDAPPDRWDPLILDLDGDGIICTTNIESGVYFDHEMDGFAESSAWVGEEDGILAIDRNNNGYIDGGSEIFGNNYIKSNGNKATSGFDALRDLDSNNDGIISILDEEFSNIKILKGDGELISLEEAGIVSINLGSSAVGEVDENGNTLVSSGTFVREDGSIGNLGDFNLVVDTMMSNEVEKIEVSEEVSVLPDIRGFGTIHSLHQTIMRDESGELRGLAA